MKLSKLMDTSSFSTLSYVITAVAFVSLELSLILILLKSITILFKGDTMMHVLTKRIEEEVTGVKVIHDIKVNSLTSKGAQTYGPAFSYNREVYIHFDSEVICMSEAVIMHEACHAIHDDTFVHGLNSMVVLIWIAVLTSVLGATLDFGWLATLLVAPLVGIAGIDVGLAFHSFIGKWMETRADMFGIKMTNSTTLVDDLNLDGPTLPAWYMYIKTPYFPHPIRKLIIVQYYKWFVKK